MDNLYLWIDYRYRNIIRQNKLLSIIIIISIILAIYIYFNISLNKNDNFTTGLLQYPLPIYDTYGYPPNTSQTSIIDITDDQYINITSTPSERVPYDPILGSTADPTANLYLSQQNSNSHIKILPNVRDIATEF